MRMILILVLTLTFSIARANINDDVFSELAKIETTGNLCAQIVSTNKLIQLGDAAVDTLISFLENPKQGYVSKWSIAMALGEIGNPKAISALTATSEANPKGSFDGNLGDLSRIAIARIKGEIPKQGKFRLLTYADQTTYTDCETGAVEVVK